MKLDSSILRYLEKDEFRVLTAIEMGMKNHEIVPIHLIESISKLKRGGAFKIVQGLLKKKLISHINKHVDGYALTYHGYDLLAINVFIKRGLIKQLGSMMGTGKESDIYLCIGPNDEEIVLKLARLGRISFRAVKSKRDYLKGRSKHNWLYLSRLSAIKEYSFMQSLFEAGLPTPTPISHNRHAILMSLLQAHPIINIVKMQDPETVLNTCFDMAFKLAELGLVHCDFNQFNLMVSNEEQVFVIDFPQMVSVNHANAEELFHKDLVCLNEFFGNRFLVECKEIPVLKDIKVIRNLDMEIKASGYLRENLKEKEINDIDLIYQIANAQDEDQEIDDENSESLREISENCEKNQESLENSEKDEGDKEENTEISEENKEGGEENKEESEEDKNEADSESSEENESSEDSPSKRSKKEKKPKALSESEIKEKLKRLRKKRNQVRTNQNKVKGKVSLNY